MFLVVAPLKTYTGQPQSQIGLISAHALPPAIALRRVDYLRALMPSAHTASSANSSNDEMETLQMLLTSLLALALLAGFTLGTASKLLLGATFPSWLLLSCLLQGLLLLGGYAAITRLARFVASPTAAVFGRSTGDEALVQLVVVCWLVAAMLTVFGVALRLDAPPSPAVAWSTVLRPLSWAHTMTALAPVIRLVLHESDTAVLSPARLAWLYLGAPLTLHLPLYVFLSGLATNLDASTRSCLSVAAPLLAIECGAGCLLLLHALYGRGTTLVKFTAYLVDRGAVLRGLPDVHAERRGAVTRIATGLACLILGQLVFCHAIDGTPPLPAFMAAWIPSPHMLIIAGLALALAALTRTLSSLCSTISALSTMIHP
ncbi:uncharacterized protein AMSG_09758 [Thecamonas trahens ATCC 50062]|uniref:Uncharacterized protein n=1 Tax=Thecamonas trahens ATCC 50062 TaxID=461836 RepID=A0A0L0DRP7_THETB|nr:hypothetical protein AMSG_09758 [Thecamonas trahens ATCC 50062]KNC54093.1 hypothetical protein AMSG_09758 [Thecamonas trahens ATCC 50062]|eukprot:XP_013754102.1 hypothetical protein AMSG_09758 [Thecamonas trahens ATCC 50062]